MISPAYGLALEAKATSAMALADCYGSWVGIRSNHVISGAGDFSGTDGSSSSISSTVDRELLVALRSLADLVVVDAETARREHYKLPSSGALLAIFSQSGSFSEIPALEKEFNRSILFSPKAPEGFQRHRHVPIPNLENPLEGLSQWAHDQGFPAVLLEAGPTLSKLAFRGKAVHQSALTISTIKLDVDSIEKAHPFDGSATLLSVANSEDATFTYWSH